jgi:SNF2 family DNA or RNA helicase
MKKLKTKGGILICSYGTVSSARMMLTEVRYDVLVMDEGHKAKNIDTELRKNTMTISVKSH